MNLEFTNTVHAHVIKFMLEAKQKYVNYVVHLYKLQQS